MRNTKEETSESNMKVDRITRQKLMEEIERLVDQGFDRELVEEGFADFLSSGIGGTSITQTFKGEIAKYVLSSLGIKDTEGFIPLAITNFFANVEFKDYPKLTDCNFVSAELTKSILETFIDKARISMGMEGVLFSALKNVMTEAGANTQAFKSLQKYVYSFICPVVKQIADKFDFSAFTGK
jgi:hypothetical protein